MPRPQIELTVKKLVGLYEMETMTKEEFKSLLLQFSKEDLVEHIYSESIAQEEPPRAEDDIDELSGMDDLN